MKGIVIAPEIEVIGQNSIKFKSTEINPSSIRQYLLYWDKIDFPYNNAIYVESSPEAEYLENVGFMKRTTVNLPLEGEWLDVFLEGQLNVFRENNKMENESWSIAQPNRNLAVSKHTGILTNNLEVQLYNSLPIPAREVSLEDILIFKERRKDELLEFRSLMDNLYFELVRSGDSERALKLYIDRLGRKIIELDKVMNESKMSRFLGSVKVRFDLKEVIKNTFIGGIGGTAIGFPTTGAALGFASSVINISSEMSLKPKGIPNDLKDYAYLYYSKDLW